MQDKERMKDFEKTKIQLDQLIEFKTKVMESQVMNNFALILMDIHVSYSLGSLCTCIFHF